MLFDIQGKRRRVVQATYLTLAVLMGGGLVLFGIGGEVSGGLFDAFSSGNGGGNGSDVVEERVERNEKRITARPRDVEARQELVRDYYSLAFSQTPSDATKFSEDARDELQKASTHWNAYLELAKDKPNPATARVALQIYDPTALNQPDDAMQVARILAERANDPASYIQLVQYSVLADDKRTQKLAAEKARDLTRNKAELRAVNDQLKQIAEAQLTQQVQQGDVQIDGLEGQGKQGAGKKQSGNGN
jgi:hypothetical protein